MSKCTIFKKNFFTDIKNLDNVSVNISWLKNLIPSFDIQYSGIWMPVFITNQDPIGSTDISFVDIFTRAKSEISDGFDPCNCSPSASGFPEDSEESNIDCSYCYKYDSNTHTFSNYSFQWDLIEQSNPSLGKMQGIMATCCSGACDTRLAKDDYLTKLPVLNTSYLTKFYDWKYHNQFPAVSNKGLGYEKFIYNSMDNMSSFDSSGPELVIDWKIKETISEIEPNDFESYHKDIDTHEKSFNRSLLASKTCGNFILTKLHSSSVNNPKYPVLSGLIGEIARTGNYTELLPAPNNFTKPYGFSNTDHFNIFAKTEKLGSYWKWNYSSGVLCWYRYYDKDLPADQDNRIIPGVDLYISEGDVFFAKNDGPEPQSVAQNQTPSDIKACPSGLKLVKNNAITGIIPSGSEFLYVSENIYGKLYSIINRLSFRESSMDIPEALRTSPINKLHLAAILATGPNYHEVTVDLLKEATGADLQSDYARDIYGQIKIFNSGMLLKQQHTANKLNIVKTKKDLANTLANKYGCYIWFPPNTDLTLKLKNSYDTHAYIDMDFEPVVKRDNTFFSRLCNGSINCSENTVEKNFTYDQKISAGKYTLHTDIDKKYKQLSCTRGTIKTEKKIDAVSLYFNEKLINEKVYGSGCTAFDHTYIRAPSYDLALGMKGDSLCYSNKLCNSSLALKYNNNIDDLDNIYDDVPDYYTGKRNVVFSSSASSPILITTGFAHGYSTNDIIVITQHSNNDANGVWTITVTGPNTFILNDSTTNKAFSTQDGTGIVRDAYKEGSFENNSVVHNRRYPANYLNPNIDRVGFHQDGGTYYDSNFLGSGNVVFIQDAESNPEGSFAINFKTKDLGIKLYDLKITRLRNRNYPECKTFPLDQSCKCFPISYNSGHWHSCDSSQSLVFTNENGVLFTPNLSTQLSPIMYSYGGYSINELHNILGDTSRFAEAKIPDHPEPRQILPIVSRKIDPLNPYGCSQQITTSFPNYVYSKWTINLLGEYNTNHADIWIKMSENVNLFNPTIPKYDAETGEFEFINNTAYRRYTTRALLNNINIYNQQQIVLASKGSVLSNPVVLELTNPYLYALLELEAEDIDLNKKLYTNLSCSTDSTTRDEHLQNISITFRRVPRKQILNFKLSPIHKLGILNKSFFHPNSGIINDDSFFNNTPIIFNEKKCSFDFYYERELFSPSSSYSNSGVIYSGYLSSGVRNILDYNDQLLNHKKLRLYLKYNNNWYEYLSPHVFGYFNKNNENIYPGIPTYFEYTKEDKHKALLNIEKYNNSLLNTTEPVLISKPSQLIPASAKKNTEFLYFHNIKPTGTIKDFSQNYYPVLYAQFSSDKDSKRKIVIPGSRTYFTILEKDPALVVNEIRSLTTEQENTILKNTYVVETVTNLRLRYKGSGDKKNLNSYEIIPPRDNRDHTFNELFIDYDNTNSDGYVANTELGTEKTKIKLINKNRPQNFYEYYVIKKALYAKKANKYGNPIGLSTAKQINYLDIYTVLEVDICETCSIPLFEGLIQFISPSLENHNNEINTESFVILQNFKDSLKNSSDYLLQNKYFDTKWGDLINFDYAVTPDLNNSTYLSNQLSVFYPSSLYNNIFYKISTNNLNIDTSTFFITSNKNNQTGTTSSGLINHTGSIYYNIHQKYNIGLDSYFQSTIEDYQNYLPFMDVNFLSGSIIKNSPIYENLKQNFTNNSISTGNIYFSGARTFVEPTTLPFNPEQKSIFFISLNKNAKLKPVLFDKDFLNDTLRVDEVYYRLANLEKNNLTSSSSGCVTVYPPSINFTNQTINDYFNTAKFDASSPQIKTQYATFPIYCDTDKAAKLCGNESCSIKTIGYTALKANYQNYQYNIISVEDLLSQTNLEFGLSVDEGLYNPIGQNKIPYIERSEIPPYSILSNTITLDGTSSCVKGDMINMPPRPLTYIDKQYQEKLTEYILSSNNKGDLVKNTDILANEMLFRAIYGSKEKINYDSIKKKTPEELLKENTTKSLSYLLQYADDRTTADKIYNFIPYDYAVQSDSSKRKINGTISIYGKLTVGAAASIAINNTLIDIVIQNINNKICAVASCNGKTYTSQFFDSQPTTVSMTAAVAGTVISPPSKGDTVQKIATCRGEITQKYWTKGRYYASMTQKRGEDTIDLVAQYKRCIAGIANTKQGCISEVDWGAGGPPDISVLSFQTIAPGGNCPIICATCNSRGWAEGPGVPGNCTLLSNDSSSVSIGSLSRATFSYGDCVSQYAGVSLSPALSRGDFDDVIGATSVRTHGGITNCNPKQSPCYGNCMGLNSDDKYGKIFDPKRYFQTGYTACECLPYTYGYCTITENSCNCTKYASGFPKIFEYQFENCNYNFQSMKGHLYKFQNGDPVESNGVSQSYGCLDNSSLSVGEQNGKAEEVCYWLECKGSTPPDYDIYTITSSTANPYNPQCPELLCSLNYDNNTININLIGNTQACIPLGSPIRNDCPAIKITLPNQTFYFNETINSECTECDPLKNEILMEPTVQPEGLWDIITEKRITILGYLPIEGDKNKNLVGGNSVYLNKGVCSVPTPLCCYDGCYDESGGTYQCAQSAPESWPWLHALTCHLEGSADPSFTPCTRGSIVGNLGSNSVSFATGSDNPDVKRNHIAYWKELMQAAYYDFSACHNNFGQFNVDDLVEGVVPGSCSQVKFEILNYPMVAFRQTLGGGQIQGGSLGVHIAYFEYEYKRPRTIQDVLLKDKAVPCSIKVASPAPSTYNITEKYTTKECSNSPSCFDTQVSSCNSDNICCQFNGLPGITARP